MYFKSKIPLPSKIKPFSDQNTMISINAHNENETTKEVTQAESN